MDVGFTQSPGGPVTGAGPKSLTQVNGPAAGAAAAGAASTTPGQGAAAGAAAAGAASTTPGHGAAAGAAAAGAATQPAGGHKPDGFNPSSDWDPGTVYGNEKAIPLSDKAEIDALYQQYLGRPADGAGLQAWGEQMQLLRQQGKSPDEIREMLIQHIQGSPEHAALQQAGKLPDNGAAPGTQGLPDNTRTFDVGGGQAY